MMKQVEHIPYKGKARGETREEGDIIDGEMQETLKKRSVSAELMITPSRVQQVIDREEWQRCNITGSWLTKALP